MPTVIRGRHSAAAEREHHRTNLWAQLARFVGLFLAPLLGLVAAWLIHLWVVGIHLHAGPINWNVSTSPAAVTLSVCLVTLTTVLIAYLAHQFAEHRRPALRNALAGSVVAVGVIFAVNVGTGPSWAWSPIFYIVSSAVAVIWAIARLDVTRNDIRAEDSEKAEGFWDRLGLSKLTKVKAKVVTDERTGEPVRIDAEVHHAPGETAAVFREGGLASMESAAAAPPGMASVSSDPARADRSTFSVPLVDPFRRPSYVGPLCAPRRSIGEWTTVADYANGQVARFMIGNGVHTPVPTSYGLIGMTRTGKTATETQMLTDWGSRRDWVCLYLNQAKGLQDASPLLPILEAVMIADDEQQALADARVAVKQVRAVMAYRQRQLSLFEVSAWSPRCADPDEAKRPSRWSGTHREHMPAMPMLTTHFGEADSLLSDGRVGDDVVFIGSKGLSLGCNVGVSLQKPDFRSMPTNLRSQIGLWLIHGLAQSDDEEYLIDVDLRKSGVSPGKWGQRKPGQHYLIGSNVEDDRNFTVAAKTRFVVGSTTAPDGRTYSFDELNDRYMAEMLRRNSESAHHQAKLDRGSAEATGGWWDEQSAKVSELRSATQSANRSTAPRNPQDPQPYVPPGLRSRPAPDVADDEPTAEETNEMHEEAATVTEVEGIELYPDGEGADVDLTQERPPASDPAPENDPLFDPEDEAKPAARDRAAALDALAKAFDELLRDDSIRDRHDPEAVIIGPGMVSDRYPFRERPWFSAEFAALAEGSGPLAGRYLLSLAEDLGVRKGKYRLRRITGNNE